MSEHPKSEYVILSRSFGKQDGDPALCRVCQQRPVPLAARHACCPRHKRLAKKVRRGELGGPLHWGPDLCRFCGKYAPPVRHGVLCGDPACAEAYGLRGWWRFRDLVRWPQPLTWLGPKLGLPEDDPRLPDLALRLAEAGRLGVYIRRDGSVGEVGRLREVEE